MKTVKGQKSKGWKERPPTPTLKTLSQHLLRSKWIWLTSTEQSVFKLRWKQRTSQMFTNTERRIIVSFIWKGPGFKYLTGHPVSRVSWNFPQYLQYIELGYDCSCLHFKLIIQQSLRHPVLQNITNWKRTFSISLSLSLSLSLSNGTTARGGPRPPSRVSSILPGLGRLLSNFYTLA